MPTELKVPEIGESVAEIYIGQWYRSEGDRVEQDEQLVELESEKATLDVHSPAGGILSKILKNSGAAAEVGEVIAYIDEGGEKKPSKKAQAESKVDQRKSRKEDEPVLVEEIGTATERVGQTAPPSAVKKTSASTAPRDGPQHEPPIKQPVPIEPTAKQPPHRRAEALQRPTEPEPSQVIKADERAEPSRREERIPMSPVRRRIAARLVEAQQNAALLTTFNEIDMMAVKLLRARFGEMFERRHRVRLGFMSFFVKATIDALQKWPELNAVIDGDEIVYRHYYDIGVAISSDKGLVVPVLRNADLMDFHQIEWAIDDFATRARDGALKVGELQGGTFTITNGGVFGSLLSTPIVNPPQSGVVGMHAIQNRPVAVNDQVVIKPMMYVALTYDHRIVDGREAVTFLRRIKETIEDPTRLLIDA